MYINSLQTVSAETPFFNILIDFKILYNNKDTIVSLRQINAFSEWKVYLPGTASVVEADPFHWLILEIADLYNVVSDIDK